VKNLLIQIGGINDIINDEDVLIVLNALPSNFRSCVPRGIIILGKKIQKTTTRRSAKDNLRRMKP
jgi:hypothetical protein